MTPPTPADLREWRTRLAITQKQAAAWVGVTKNTWARRERGEQKAPPEMRYAMAWIGLHGPLEGM